MTACEYSPYLENEKLLLKSTEGLTQCNIEWYVFFSYIIFHFNPFSTNDVYIRPIEMQGRNQGHIY